MPFAGNQITTLSPVAQKILGYLPGTNLPGTANGNGVAGTQQNFLNPGALDHVITTQTSFRIDENLTEKNKAVLFLPQPRTEFPQREQL